MPQTFYITTPIYYVNDRPHIGHVYTTTIADVLARYHRLRGDDVFFLTGTDEHAAKVVDAAKQRGLSTQEWADRNAAEFEGTFQRLGMTNNDFIRTSQDRHKRLVEKYVRALLESGDVYLGDYEGWYDPGQEEYVPQNKAKEQDYKSAISGRPLAKRKEKNYFFRLSEYRESLLTLLETGGEVDGCTFDVQPDARKNEIIERIRTAEDVPISRDIAGAGLGDWCIKVPGDDTHAIYVWIDALFNYLTTIDTPERKKYWPANVHLIAKDILWFHAAIWPAMLLALRKLEGFDWVALPGVVYSHSFWIAEGRKMSKSEGNFVDLEKIDDYVRDFGLDALRYFLATKGPMGTTDSDFAHDRFVEVYNSELANTVGNCLNRVLNMTNRYFDGEVPTVGPDVPWTGVTTSTEGAVDSSVRLFPDAMHKLQLAIASDYARAIVGHVDGYIEQTQPFKLAKDEANKPQVATILYNCAEAMRIALLLLWPIIPGKAGEGLRRLGCGHYVDQLDNNGLGQLEEWVKWGGLKPGTKLSQGDPLFPRYQVQNKA